MNRILLTALASVALCFPLVSQAFGTVAPTSAEPHGYHEKKPTGKSSEEILKESEEHLGKVKDSGASLPADLKTEFNYNLEIATIEIKTLRDPNHKNSQKHHLSFHRHLEVAERILRKHEHQEAQAKKAAERKAKAEERQARAEERMAKAAERKAKREADKAEKAAVRHNKSRGKLHTDGLDHGRSEGGDIKEAGSEAAKPMSEEKK